MENHTLSFAEKRAAYRYPIVIFVEFENGTGWTRDISTNGACIETEQPFLSGAAIQFSMLKLQIDDCATRLQCKGVVVRAEQNGHMWRVGVAMEAIRFDG